VRLRKERDPRFVERRTFWSKGYRIYVGGESRAHCFQFTKRVFRELSSEVQEKGIACVGQLGRERLWWTGREDLFWADDELSSADVELLVWDRERRQEGRLRRLRRIRTREIQAGEARRERIPEEVRNFVWRRDGGRCVACDSDEDLQFDHVIPVSRGGGTAAENIQILCGDCNRAKGDAIG
jgi:5-methylcytosine-specific restriction endonuclease McrA